MAGDLHLQDLIRFNPGGCGHGLCCVVAQGPAAVCEEEQHNWLCTSAPAVTPASIKSPFLQKYSTTLSVGAMEVKVVVVRGTLQHEVGR